MRAVIPMLRFPGIQRLRASLEAACERELRNAGFDVDSLALGPAGEKVRAYCRVLHRSIAPIPRAVEHSRELQAQLAQLGAERNDTLVQCIAVVENEMRQGLDLNVRLSRKYYGATYSDPLLNDLSVHHFHLGTRSRSPRKLCKESRELLFGMVAQETVYLIHLGDHRSFGKIAFEQTMFGNWPQLFTSLDLIGGSRATPSEERAKARHCGVSMQVQIQGQMYMAPWSGQTTDGTSIWATQLANQLIYQVDTGRNWILGNANWIVEQLTQRGHIVGTLPLEIRLSGSEVWFLNPTTQLWICPVREAIRFRRSCATPACTTDVPCIRNSTAQFDSYQGYPC